MRSESPATRGIWADVLALAGDSFYGDEGFIKVADEVGYSDDQIVAILRVEIKEWLVVKEILIKTDRIEIVPRDVIAIRNWKKYQSEYERQKPYRLQDKVTSGSNKEKREERRENIVEDVVAYWNTKPHLTNILTISKLRKDKLLARVKSEHFMLNYKKAIDKLAVSKFATGQSKSGWSATIDWFISNDNNYVKTLEGKYDDKNDPFTKY